MTTTTETRDSAIRHVVQMCNLLPGATTWNAAEFMYDLLAAAPAAPAPEPVADVVRAAPQFHGDPGGARVQFRKKLPVGAVLYASPPAPVAASAVTWRPIHTAPEDTHVILATSGGVVGEALMLRDEDTGQQKWTWALGPVHPNHVPLGWMPMPSSIDQPVEA